MCVLPFPETNSKNLKTGGWETILSFWEGIFPGENVSFRQGIDLDLLLF